MIYMGYIARTLATATTRTAATDTPRTTATAAEKPTSGVGGASGGGTGRVANDRITRFERDDYFPAHRPFERKPITMPTVKVLPVSARGVSAGDTVGQIMRTEKTAKGGVNTTITPVKVEKVVSTHGSKQDAEKAAREHSANHAGENVAIVEKTSYRFVRENSTKPKGDDPAHGVGGMFSGMHLVETKSYSVVTVDPGIDGSHADEVYHDDREHAPRIVSVGNDKGMTDVPDKSVHFVPPSPVQQTPPKVGGPITTPAPPTIKRLPALPGGSGQWPPPGFWIDHAADRHSGPTAR